MYAKDEVKRTKEAFWTAYGQYMRVVPFAEAERQSWVNYKTGVKHLFFRMEAGFKDARIAIEIDHPDPGIRELMFAQFAAFRPVLETELEETWSWYPIAEGDYGKAQATIEMRLEEVNVMNKSDWPALISFFKPRMIALDSFWSSAKYAFDIFT